MKGSEVTVAVVTDPNVRNDLIVNHQRFRVELKTVSMFTSKDTVPADFFDKDLAHFDGEPELNRMGYEGASRNHRMADICLLFGHGSILRNSASLSAILGNGWLDEMREENIHSPCTGMPGTTCLFMRRASSTNASSQEVVGMAFLPRAKDA